jgi:hypothetical protein
VNKVSSISTDLMLMSVFLDEPIYDLSAPAGEGTYFAISITKSHDLLHHGIQRRDATEFPELIALKIPRLELSITTEDGQKLLTSMAMEFQIVKNQYLRAHENITTFYGTCWHYGDLDKKLILPTFVYEAAEFGDLEKFLASDTELTLGQQIRLCLNVTEGV